MFILPNWFVVILVAVCIGWGAEGVNVEPPSPVINTLHADDDEHCSIFPSIPPPHALHSIEPGRKYSHSPSSEPPPPYLGKRLSKDIPPISGIGYRWQLQKHPFSWFSREIFPRLRQKTPPPPLSLRNGNAHACMCACWKPTIEITWKEAGEWNGWSLGFSRRNVHFNYIWI